MSIYAIADLHLSLSADKPMDVFDGWQNYMKKIYENWSKTVKNEDTVVIAGDISWAMKLEDAYKDLEFLNSLPGKKILIKGNHDYWWSTAKKINDFLQINKFDSISILFNSAIECENKWICGTRGWMYNPEEPEDQKIFSRETQRLVRSIESVTDKNKEIIVFLHYPPVYAFAESQEIINILIERNIKKCYYGHIHGSGATKKVVQGNYKGIDFKLISCDYVNFCPVLVG